MNFDISGVKIFFRIPTHLPLIGDIAVSEMVVVSWLVTLIITELCIFLTRDLEVEHIGKRQAFAELIMENAGDLMQSNTDRNKFDYLTPLVGALSSMSMISNLISLVGLRSLTADLSVEAAWVVAIFTMVTLNKTKAGGLLGYLEGFTTPIPVMAPFNIFSETATPISMTRRHLDNVFSDVATNGLIYAAFNVASTAPFRLIPGAVGDFLSYTPILTVGLLATMSFYSDRFSGIMQVPIFTMLATMHIANASEG